LGLKKEHHGSIWVLLAGGSLGLTMLIRQEVAVIFPFLALVLFLVDLRFIRRAIGRCALILVGMLLVISPWVARNWLRSGEIYLDVPGNRFNLILNTIGPEGDWLQEKPSREEGAYLPVGNQRLVVADQLPSSGSLNAPDLPIWLMEMQQASDSLDSRTPLIRVIIDHLTNQLVQTVVYLPSYPLYTDLDFISKGLIGKLDRYYGGLLYSPESYARKLPYWWRDWSGKIPVKSLIPVTGSLFLITLGISGAWREDRKTAFNPLLSYVGYILIFALIRRSGGRFLQEIDWVSILYYSIGLMEITRLSLHWWQGRTVIEYSQDQKFIPNRSAPRPVIWILIAAALLMAGGLPPLAEVFFTADYPPERLTVLTENLLGQEKQGISIEDQKILEEFLTQDGSAIVGRAYYPRYFKEGENLIDIRPEVLGKLDQRYSVGRMEFYLIGSGTSWVVLPTEEIPQAFPHGAEVFAAGCLKDGALDALTVILFDESGSVNDIHWREGKLSEVLDCPLTWPDRN
jgi:hypothetical protein